MVLTKLQHCIQIAPVVENINFEEILPIYLILYNLESE